MKMGEREVAAEALRLVTRFQPHSRRARNTDTSTDRPEPLLPLQELVELAEDEELLGLIRARQRTAASARARFLVRDQLLYHETMLEDAPRTPPAA